MSRNGRIVIGVIVVLVIVAVAAGGYVWFAGGNGQASQPISAPTLDPSTLNKPTATTAVASAATSESTEVAAAPTSASTVSAATGAGATTVAAAATSEATAAAASTGSGVLFNIVSDKSTVSFAIHETLRGEPTDVLGTTNQVAGQLYVNFDNPSASQVGVIRTDVRTLKTPEEFRDRAIRGQILQSSSDQYEYVDFTPTAIQGMPATITIGQPVTFKIVGDLKIRDITQSVTFDATVTPTSKTELTGSATTTVTRTQYKLTIPNVPFVADVGDEVTLKIDFVAQAAS